MSSTSVPFHERVTIQSLLSPVSEGEFRAHYWEKKPLIVSRHSPDYYGDLFTLQDFDASLKGGVSYIKTAEATTKKVAMHLGTGPQTMERILTDMRDGHTLVLDSIQNLNPKLGQLCRLLAQETGEAFQTGVYLTPPRGKGFLPHWDNRDVFVMQILGHKHWQIESERRTLPMRDGVIEMDARQLRGELHEFTLEQGDLVYIPRGFVHAAECGAETSLHITMGVNHNSWDQLLISAITAAIQCDDSLRLSLPPGHMRSGGTEIVKRLMDVLHGVADPAFLAQMLDQFRSELVQKAGLDISGQLKSFFQPCALELDDRVGARRGLFYIFSKDAEAVTLKVGTRVITFPDFFGEALEFALQTSNYAIRDLPGGLDDDLKLVFIERLMEEALVTRR
jgi:ribosomal protein L16 Arg81 hydroxylase